MKGGQFIMTRTLKTFFIFAITMVTSMVFSITTNAKEITIDNNTTQYTVSEGTIYWESSDYSGFGIHNTICDENPYTNIINNKLPVRINGYSILDHNGNIIESYFDEKIPKFNISTTTNEQEIMVHIEEKDKNGYRLGWIHFNQISSNENSSNYTISEIPKENEEKWFEYSAEKTVDKTTDTLKKKCRE